MPVGDPQFWLVTLVAGAIVGRALWVIGRGVVRRRRGAPQATRVSLTVGGGKRR